MNTLFDIARCKCVQIPMGCKCSEQIHKIPRSEIDFILDQRGERQRSIQMPDFVIPSAANVLSGPGTANDPAIFSEGTSASVLDRGSEYVPRTSDESISSTEHESRLSYSVRRNLPNFAMECDRYNAHDRPAAAMASALLKDFGITDENGIEIVIDKNKVKRERFLLQQELMRRNRIGTTLKAFAFDSKKDKTLTQVRTEDGKLHPRQVTETHITVLRQPSSVFLGYAVAMETSSAPEISEILLHFFREKQIDLSDLIAVCCDGEVKNTGRFNGILRCLENHIGRPLHWFVCLLHFNETIFRHIFEKIDASHTKGPTASTGVIARAIENVDQPVLK